MKFKINFDGAVSKAVLGCDMGVGVAVFIDGGFFPEFSRAIGIEGWNTPVDAESSSNVAEWLGCIEAFKVILEYLEEGDEVEICSDSQLITNQFNGEFAIKKEHFRKYRQEALRLYHQAGLGGLKIIWVPRELNREADRLSKIGLRALVYGETKENQGIVPEVRKKVGVSLL